MKAETRFVEYIPENERHGNVRSLFSVWFTVNFMLLAVVTGGLAVVFGLNLFWSIVSILLGNLIGAIFMALHSVQGPKLGIPQMIQSRAQFGVIGAIFPLLLVILMYLGYFASNAVLGAQAVTASTSIPIGWSITILSVITFVITFYGYEMIHKLSKYIAILLGVIFLFVSILVFKLDFPANSWSPSQFQFAPFLASVSVFATWQLTFAPYVADYSRYLPKDTDPKKAFIYTYGGSVLSAVWMMILGASLTIAIPSFLDNASLSLSALVGSQWSLVMYFAIALGIVATNVFNLYGAFMSLTTITDTIVRLRGTIQTRFLLLFICGIIGTALAIVGHGNFLENFSNLILFLAYFLFPWTTINLVDYYLLRHGNYNVDALFDPNGEYGRYNWKAMIAYAVTIICEIPFINTTIYQGFISKSMHDIDFAWIIALTIPGVIYYVLMKSEVEKKTLSKYTA
ncbi:purine-cytosine permease family protein [Bacillus norwichensis]|uniref:Cytosine permease n=1 Tax=Bacillus norwichensis TaxID=2762217 RepID=A0ABR8VR09_9BACI|nr:cytosine permease [Bacillus norwichensis]MBD8007205.1 cytosine permease [Bacillus norwichensis]